jgi:hypothetical protein
MIKITDTLSRDQLTALKFTARDLSYAIHAMTYSEAASGDEPASLRFQVNDRFSEFINIAGLVPKPEPQSNSKE